MAKAACKKLPVDPDCFSAIHTVGVSRHPQTWFAANRAAVEHCWGWLDVSDPLTKEKLANIVLRICDAVDAP